MDPVLAARALFEFLASDVVFEFDIVLVFDLEFLELLAGQLDVILYLTIKAVSDIAGRTSEIVSSMIIDENEFTIRRWAPAIFLGGGGGDLG